MNREQIGLALSGGGSRAIAFHLGCLRTLNEFKILDKVTVLSTVSGGSVIGGLYAINREPFPVFEERVRSRLARGFIQPAVCKAFTTTEGIRAFFCFATILLINLPIWGSSAVGSILSLTLPPVQRELFGSKKFHPPVRRFASRTTILKRVFDDDVFQGLGLKDLPDNAPLLVINAAELRTGSAFYFTQRSSGSWRYGELENRGISLAHAVTASAAYPLFLPALDEILTFNNKDGARRVERVALTDGGVYDNLGLAPLWPDRDPLVSLNVRHVDTIICCRAGYGPRFDSPPQFFTARMKSAFSCVHDRSQNASMKRLFDLLEMKKLKTVLIPYLGQDDSQLKHPTESHVSREEVLNYPTNFSAMSSKWIDQISRRGEQLTKALLREHRPDLLS